MEGCDMAQRSGEVERSAQKPLTRCSGAPASHPPRAREMTRRREIAHAPTPAVRPAPRLLIDQKGTAPQWRGGGGSSLPPRSAARLILPRSFAFRPSTQA